MHIIPRGQITVESRQRTGEHKSFRDQTLHDSILERGLFHPIVLAPKSPAGSGYRLVAGGRRLANIDWIAEERKSFFCNRQCIMPGNVPAIFLNDLDLLDLHRAEYEENARRMELPWQDATKALAFIHQLEQERNPQQTVIQTAKQIETTTKQPFETIRKKIAEAQIVARHLNDPQIAKARNANEAYGLVMQKEEALIRTLQAKRLNLVPASAQVFHGDCSDVFKQIPEASIDLFLADPPYAIGAGDAGFRGRTVHHHNYEDTQDSAKHVISSILNRGFHLAKNQANLFIFSDINLWPFLMEESKKAGWTPFRTPIIWAKSDSEGLAPWGRQGFRRTYEIIFYATKGQKGLLSSPVDILRYNRVAKGERDYGPSKPVELLKELISCSTMPRDTVLDPCCGSGNSLVAALSLNRSCIGIDKEEAAYNLTMAKISQQGGTPDVVPETSLSDL